MTADIPTKALPDKLRGIWDQIVNGVNFVLPRPVTLAEGGRIAGQPPPKLPEPKMAPALDAYRAKFDAQVKEISDKLAKGEINPLQWRALMEIELRLLHLTAAAVGKGGFGYLTPEDRTAVERKVAEQVGYLNNWLAQIERQGVPSAEYLANRARQYGLAGGATVAEAHNRALGFPALPFAPKDGKSTCKNGCRCGWDWRILDNEKKDADVYWRIQAGAEHCPECIERAKVLNPLQIRNGQFVNLPTDMSKLVSR